MQNYCLVVQYDGTDYSGFQIQLNQPTIQGKLEEALFCLAKVPIRVTGSGRTDAGVHSEGQVVSFKSNHLTVPVERLPQALNSILPRDIRVIKSKIAASDFHARYSAVQKTYRYQIYHGRYPNVFYRRYALWVPHKVDWEAVNAAANMLIGKHNFSAFAASGSSVKSTIRTMFAVNVDFGDDIKQLRFTADGFLYNMVRNIVGTLLEVGSGKRPPEDIINLLEKGDRTLAGPTAPSVGLFLEQVDYA